MKFSLNNVLKVLAIIALAIYIGWYGAWSAYVHNHCNRIAIKTSEVYSSNPTSADSAYDLIYQACSGQHGL